MTPLPDPLTPLGGLRAAEVAERVAEGRVNEVDAATSRSLGLIIRSNVFTRFNAMLGALTVVVLAAGSWRDATFGIVVVVNALAGVVQEVRAKRTLDRLAVLNAPLARVHRDGAVSEIAVAAVVADDLLELRAGDQVPADGVVVEDRGLEVDESLLTGESRPVHKRPGDEVLSGSVAVAGSALAQVTRVGAEAYAQRLATEAKRFGLTRSELTEGTNRLLRWISWALVVVGPLLWWSESRTAENWQEAVIGATAGMVGMVPEGLVLLTSLAFLLAALSLARNNVLVQELPAVEGLARVDVVCLDKTGTLTEGDLVFDRFEELERDDAAAIDLGQVLGALADEPSPNATLVALAARFDSPHWSRSASVPFSSARKWSAVRFEVAGTWVLGAPEIVLAGKSASPARLRADALADGGERVLVLASAAALPAEGEALGAVTPMALLVFAERLRPDAPDTLAYFASQGVTCKVISGDNVRTVAAVAGRVGLPGADRYQDARSLPPDGGPLGDAVEAANVFGRVTPEQKRAMVRALQQRGHVVAMTGDGVNDALALKDADIGVAMGSGAPATRAVAQLVLLDGRFAHLPRVVAEGRRVMANIERVASLFVIKNVYAAALAVAVALARVPYPFLPRHLTLISTLTIGLPAFFLALAPNSRRYEPGFLRRVLAFSVPVGLATGAAVFAAYAIARRLGANGDEARTAACITAMLTGLCVVVLVSQPVRGWKLTLVAVMAALFLLCLTWRPLREYFALDVHADALTAALPLGAAGGLAAALVWHQRAKLAAFRR